ncbi:MAG: protein-L-isoaspartate(D-aspartate) O-methyltransferase [Myxococcota bacterium]
MSGKSTDEPSRAPSAGDIDTEQFRRERAKLVKSIQHREQLSPEVLQALLDVPRHAFVPEGQRHRAYDDNPLSIGHGQTISQPTVVAMMTEALDLAGDEVVLEVGTGSGYQAAVLSRIVKRVESIEIVEPLAEHAREALERVGYDNVNVHVGDGYAGLPEQAPFDRIIITAAPPEVPPKLVQQLAKGGKMVLPVGPRFGVQDLIVLEKQADGSLKRTNLGPVRFVPMVRGDDDGESE